MTRETLTCTALFCAILQKREPPHLRNSGRRGGAHYNSIDFLFILPAVQGLGLFPQREQIGKGLRAFAGIPQQSGGMVDRHIAYAVTMNPLTVLPGDPEIGIDQPHGGNTTQTDDDLRLQQRQLLLQKANTGILLLRHGIPVLRRTAFDDVADVAVVPP